MSTEQPNIRLEPVLPSVEFVKHAGSRNGGQTADHAAWVQDMEDRRNRAAEFEAKRQQVKPKEIKVELSAIDEVLNAVDEAIEDCEGPNGYGNLTNL